MCFDSQYNSIYKHFIVESEHVTKMQKSDKK